MDSTNSSTKKYFHLLLDGLNLVLVDVHEGVDKEKNSWKRSFAVRKRAKCYRRMHKKFQDIAQQYYPKTTPSLGSLNH